MTEMTEDELDRLWHIKPEDVRACCLNDVCKTLARISFAPSCVDMGWEWEVENVYVASKVDDSFVSAGYRFRTTFQRPDRETGEVGKGFGRWWEIPLETTESAVVKTAYAAAKMILEHELMESFKWRNTRPFDPHSTIRELASIAGSRYTAGIP